MGPTGEHGGVAKDSKEAVLNERRVGPEKQRPEHGLGPGAVWEWAQE